MLCVSPSNQRPSGVTCHDDSGAGAVSHEEESIMSFNRDIMVGVTSHMFGVGPAEQAAGSAAL